MFSFLGGGGRGGAVAASFAVKRKKHRRTGWAGEGCWSPPPKFWATQIFWAARENLGKASF